MHRKILKILQGLQKEYGNTLFLPANRQRFKALLLDRTKNQYAREVYLVLESLELGVLKELERGHTLAERQNVCFRRLTYDFCMSEEGARYSIALWSALLQTDNVSGSRQKNTLRRAN